MTANSLVRAIWFVAVFCVGHSLTAADGLYFFETKIRPVLVANCYECHSAEAAKKGKLKGGMQLDTREGIRKGGDTGPTVEPNHPEKSLILSALRQEKNLEMPPKGKLPDAIIADFEKWIAMGALDPRDGKPVDIVKATDFEKAREFWSFKPIKKPATQKTKGEKWTTEEIDAFVLRKLNEHGLKPVIDADRRTLIRRLYFDLIGLPPTIEELHTALKEPIADVVDRLLASPHFGERWGRHWLDVARYADSNGRARNVLWRHAWRYRDWVIAAFNDDLPYNEFVRRQIAGDLLPAESPEQRDANIIATGYLALGPKSLEESKKEQFLMDMIDEQIEVVSRGIIGLSVACARCHDHKFDPVPTSDYYSLAGIFRSTQTLYGFGPPGNWNINNDSDYQPVGRRVGELQATAKEHRDKVIAKTRERGKARSDRYRVVRNVADAKRKLPKARGPDKEKLQASIDEMEKVIKDWDDRIKKMEKELLALQDNAPAQPEYAMAVREKSEPENCRIHIRGEIATLGERVNRGNLRFLDLPNLKPATDSASGRMQLANWLASDRNPLTPRVFVNRVWQHLFGRGLVSTPDDFGKMGARPSHPELLDHVAAEFVENGWSIKRLIRAIVSSRTYQLGSQVSQVNQERDPENVWLWRMKPRRLEVEPFRDSVMSISGQLDRTPFTGSVVAGFHLFKDVEFNSATKISGEQMEIPHRSVYLPVVRGILPEMLDLFDFADPSSLVGTRDETTVPAQSLFLMNGEWIILQARATAGRLLAETSWSDEERINWLFESAFGRLPAKSEIERLTGHLRVPEELLEAKADTSELEKWTSVCQTIIASSELRFVR